MTATFPVLQVLADKTRLHGHSDPRRARVLFFQDSETEQYKAFSHDLGKETKHDLLCIASLEERKRFWPTASYGRLLLAWFVHHPWPRLGQQLPRSTSTGLWASTLLTRHHPGRRGQP